MPIGFSAGNPYPELTGPAAAKRPSTGLYQNMAEHGHTAVIPARVKAAKDKAAQGGGL